MALKVEYFSHNSMPEQDAVSQVPIGKVTHYFNKLGVAVIKFVREVPSGTHVHFKGAHTDFTATLDSMQYEHQPVMVTSKDEELGVKVPEPVHEGDLVLLEE